MWVPRQPCQERNWAQAGMPAAPVSSQQPLPAGPAQSRGSLQPPAHIPPLTSTAVVAADGLGCRGTFVVDIISNYLNVSGCSQKHKPCARASLCALAGNQLSTSD